MVQVSPGGGSRRGSGTRLRNGPGERALEAMAKAVRRARVIEDGDGAAPEVGAEADPRSRGWEIEGGRDDRSEGRARDWSDLGVGRPDGSSLAAANVSEGGLRRSSPTKRGIEHVLRRSVLVTAALVAVVFAVALGLELSSGPGSSPVGRHTESLPPATSTAGGARSANKAPPNANPVPVGSPSSSNPPPAPTSTAPPPAPGSAPVLNTITPDRGAAGQAVTLDGSNLFSPDGHIVASVGGQPADIRCSTQTSCVLTVPMLTSPPGSILVTMTTQAGTSNPVPFSFEPSIPTPTPTPTAATAAATSTTHCGRCRRRR
jgi:IPT/TIG domain